MNFKSNYIFNQLKHDPKHYVKKIISDRSLFTLLWYFVSKESYAQRITAFDSIFSGKSSPYDRFFLLWLHKQLSLDELRIYTKNMVDLDMDVDLLSGTDLHRNLLYLHASGTTTFTSFFEKLRNSIAHGTFNKSNRFFMIGQKNSKPNSYINFYFQTSSENHEKITSIVNSIETTSIDDLCKLSLKTLPQIAEKDGELYYQDKRIIIEHNYKFKPVKENGNEISQIKELVNQKEYCNALIILCCSTHSAFEDDYLKSKNIGVISYAHLHTFFDVNIQYK